MFGLGVPELLLILLVVLIFFGADKIPQLAKSLGKGMSEFRKAQQDLKDEITKEEEPTKVSPSDSKVSVSPYERECPSCHGTVPKESNFCPLCGKQMPNPPICSSCQRVFLPEEKFCPSCGQVRPS